MDYQDKTALSLTESVCPECLVKVPALLARDGDNILMQKLCPSHGDFQALLWRGASSYQDWSRPKIPLHNSHPATEVKKGCPFDCGLCPEHRQQTCAALLEVTSRCNLKCAVCFADSGDAAGDDPDLPTIRGWYEALLANGYPCNIQLSGGEPTLRDDLPYIVALGRSAGFEFIQLNTNGLRLAADPYYVEKLKEAGLSSVFLQFDGTENGIYEFLRGGAFFDRKVQAIHNCERMELGVVLVPTLVPGVNVHNIGDIIEFALERLPAVRGVHFQPITYSGRYPAAPSDQDRLTLPDILHEIELQTRGIIKAESFRPPGCENAYCSFHGDFVVMPDGRLKALTGPMGQQRSCCPESAESGAGKTRQFVAQHWSLGNPTTSTADKNSFSMGQWDVLLERARTHRLCISAMAFQDAWNLDLERLKDCCIHVVAPDGRLVPFCAYNITGSNGACLYRRGRRP